MRVYSSIIVVCKNNIQKKISKVVKKYARFERINIESLYDIAYKFYYNDQFREKLRINYLGSIQFVSYQVKADIVLITNEKLSINSIHLNLYNLENANILNTNTIDNHVFFVKNFYNYITHSKESNKYFKNELWLITLKNSLHTNKQRKFTFNISTYHYSSICINKVNNFVWEKYALIIWKLLYLHIDGVDTQEITNKLEKRMWSSTAFFRNFMQPGSIVSISIPFPKDIYNSNLKWFVPEKSEEFTDNELPKKYDYLPEYPPLRYLGLLTLEFSGFNEEILRYSYEKLLHIQNQNILFRILNSIRYLDKIDNLNYKVFSLEYIRPPIIRDFVTKCIDNKMQKMVQSNLTHLKASILNYIILSFTIIAIVLSIASNSKLVEFIEKLF